MEVGVMRRQVLRLKFPKPLCSRSVLSASSLDIYEFAPHLILMIIGMMLAVAIYILEKIKFKFEKSFSSVSDNR